MSFNKKSTRYGFLSVAILMTLAFLFQNCSSGNFAVENIGSNLDSSSSGDPGADAGNDPNPDPMPTPQPTTNNPPDPGQGPPTLPPPVAIGGTVTDLKIENTGSSEQINVPVTFGQVFSQGALLATETLAGKLSDGSLLSLQVNAKAKHADGSIRHAVISAVLPKLSAGQTETLFLIKAAADASPPPALTPQAMMAAGFSASVNITLGGVAYSASPNAFLNAGTYKTWLAGPLVNEWLVSVPLKTAAGVAHPHLTANFAIRSYSGLNRVRFDVAIENGWAHEPNPQGFTYDTQITVAGTPVYTKTALTHYHHARWRKTFWWGAEPKTHIKHNIPYLIATKAVPNYDQTIVISEPILAALQASWTGAKTEPMGAGLAMPAMPTTGGRRDMGLMPGWVVQYLLSMDKRAKNMMLGTADLAGSWSAHYRDKQRGYAVSPIDYPYTSVLGNPGDNINPATGKDEKVALCKSNCDNPNILDSAHEPGFTYLPYVVTGDFYYMEELQFYAMAHAIHYLPNYRGFEKALLMPDQVRGQAWSLRTLAEVAYITPDDHPLKSHFESFMSHNLDWYNLTYTHNPSPDNTLGAITDSMAMVYAGGQGLGPWQDDFFTSAAGRAAELGFEKAKPLLAWKSKFPISRMVGSGTCWILASSYQLNLRNTPTSPIYTTIEQVYLATNPPDLTSLPCNSPAMASKLGLKVGEMVQYASSNSAGSAIMQAALAYSVNSANPSSLAAWQTYMSRSVKPDYSDGPQFAIVPR